MASNTSAIPASLVGSSSNSLPEPLASACHKEEGTLAGIAVQVTNRQPSSSCWVSCLEPGPMNTLIIDLPLGVFPGTADLSEYVLYMYMVLYLFAHEIVSGCALEVSLHLLGFTQCGSSNILSVSFLGRPTIRGWHGQHFVQFVPASQRSHIGFLCFKEHASVAIMCNPQITSGPSSPSHSHEMDDAGPPNVGSIAGNSPSNASEQSIRMMQDKPLAVLQGTVLAMQVSIDVMQANMNRMQERFDLLKAAAIFYQRQSYSPPVVSSHAKLSFTPPQHAPSAPTHFSPPSSPSSSPSRHLPRGHHLQPTPTSNYNPLTPPTIKCNHLTPLSTLHTPHLTKAYSTIDPLDPFPQSYVVHGAHRSSPLVPPTFGATQRGFPSQYGAEATERSSSPLPTSPAAARQVTAGPSLGKRPSIEPFTQLHNLPHLMYMNTNWRTIIIIASNRMHDLGTYPMAAFVRMTFVML
ncbi:hypothetical protein EMCRGX_G013361 [Ephydatia muelleri]